MQEKSLNETKKDELLAKMREYLVKSLEYNGKALANSMNTEKAQRYSDVSRNLYKEYEGMRIAYRIIFDKNYTDAELIDELLKGAK